MVPNVPCGVERRNVQIGVPCDCMVPNVPCGVERRGQHVDRKCIT